MEESVEDSDFVLLICTPEYAKKANKRRGGVGYEAMIITGELADDIQTTKFIPVLRSKRIEALFVGTALKTTRAAAQMLRAARSSWARHPTTGRQHDSGRITQGASSAADWH
jgi:uncharacterized alpha/beta hydrolase family protein